MTSLAEQGIPFQGLHSKTMLKSVSNNLVLASGSSPVMVTSPFIEVTLTLQPDIGVPAQVQPSAWKTSFSVFSSPSLQNDPGAVSYTHLRAHRDQRGSRMPSSA